MFDAVHNRNTKLVVISLTDENDNIVYVDTTIVDVNTVRFTFAVAPASGAVYRWTIIASY